jgi:hypothetical protein
VSSRRTRSFSFALRVGLLGLVVASVSAFPTTSAAATPLSSLRHAWTLESNQGSAYFGSSVAPAGDVNGDGFTDVVVGAPYFDDGQVDEGQASVFLGSPAGPGSAPAWTAESDQDQAYFGTSVASAGDVNGDGFDDVVVGAPRFSDGELLEGKAFLYLGSASGVETSAAWTAESDNAFAYFGQSVASAGDVNGDGFGDVIVGAPYFSGRRSEGRAFLYLGSPTGLGTSPAWTSGGLQGSEYFGQSVASAGDVNGDGFDDVVVGAPSYDDGQINEGGAFLYLGSATGLSASAAWTSEADQNDASYGWTVASAGDVNGDGFGDVIVGSPYFDHPDLDEGRAFVYLGSSSGLGTSPAWVAESNQALSFFAQSVASAGDVNADGFDDVIVGAPYYAHGENGEGVAFLYLGSANGLDTAAARAIEPNRLDVSFGESVASAGDVNDDGFGDFIAGAPYYDHGQVGQGIVAVFRGGAA